MKIVLLAFLSLSCLSARSFGQTPDWSWATGSSAGTHNESGYSIAVNSAGNVYVAGAFNSSVFAIDTLTLAKKTATLTDMFIAKYSNDGDVIWAKNFGGSTEAATASSITVDESGNLYVAGSFTSDTLIIDHIRLPNTNPGLYDMFLAKFDADGNVVWAKSAGGLNSEKINSITRDNSGYLYFTGTYRSDFTLGGTHLINNGNHDIFVAKWDTSGHSIWVKSAGGTVWDEGYSINVDAAGNIFVAGAFTSPALQLGSTSLVNAGSADMFTAKYDNDGNVLWAKSTGGNAYETANSIITDVMGNVYVTGSFTSSSVSFGNTTLNRVASDDLFVVKYDNKGNTLWARSVGGYGMERGECVNADNMGNIYITGWYSSPALTFGSTTLTNAGGRNIFTSKWDASGNVIWAKSPLGNNYHTLNSACLDKHGNVYITGHYECSTLTFGNTVLTNVGLQYTGDLFVAKLGNATVGISDLEEQTSLSLSPNPFSSLAVLKKNNGFNNATLTLYTLNGQRIKQIKNISGQSYMLRRDDLQNGTYFIHLSENNKTIGRHKVVIID